MRTRALLLGSGLAAAALTSPSAPALAFCRTTTCDAGGADLALCARDADGCSIQGAPLYWGPGCTAIAVQQAGSPLLGITAEHTGHALEQAIAAWHGVDCNMGSPAFQFVLMPPVSCDQVEFNPGGPNVNVVTYRDDNWEHSLAATALTTVTFSAHSGEIFGADVELNSAWHPFTLSDDAVVVDLASTLTHELGHVLGLAHSSDPEASMFAQQYDGEVKLRSLEADDALGICSIYPPGRPVACQPERDFSERCGGNVVGQGCAFGVPPGLPSSAVGSWMLALAFGFRSARNRVRRIRSRNIVARQAADGRGAVFPCGCHFYLTID